MATNATATEEPIVIQDGEKTVGEIPAERYPMPEVTEREFDLSESWYCEGIPRGGNYPRADAIASRAPDGTIYVSYQHPAVLLLHKSSDGGKTWEKVNIVQPPPNRQYGNVYAFGAIPDGSLLVMYSGRRTPSPRWDVPQEDPSWDEFGAKSWTYMARSQDGGVTWDFHHKVNQGDNKNVQGIGQIMTLADGQIIATATLCSFEHHHADHIWRSFDDGKTFQLSDSISHHSAESKIDQLPSGRLIAAVRTVYADYHDKRNKRSAMIHSDDLGKTWSEHVMMTTDIGDCPSEFVAMPDGRVVFLYCKRYEPAAIVARISPDGGETWDDRKHLVRQMEGKNPGVYPSSMLMDDETILTVSSTHEGTPLQAIHWKPPVS